MSVEGNITIGQYCFPPCGDVWNEGLEVRKEVSQNVKLSRACEVTVVSQLLGYETKQPMEGMCAHLYPLACT